MLIRTRHVCAGLLIFQLLLAHLLRGIDIVVESGRDKTLLRCVEKKKRRKAQVFKRNQRRVVLLNRMGKWGERQNIRP